MPRPNLLLQQIDRKLDSDFENGVIKMTDQVKDSHPSRDIYMKLDKQAFGQIFNNKEKH